MVLLFYITNGGCIAFTIVKGPCYLQLGKSVIQRLKKSYIVAIIANYIFIVG